MNYKKFFAIFTFTASILASCGDDNSTKKTEDTNNAEDTITVQSEWTPKSMQLIKIVPLYTFDYPHQQGCDKDYLQLKSNNTGVFFRHTDTNCTVQTYNQAFTKNGDQVVLNLAGYSISGTLQQTDNQMTITGDADDYMPLIQSIYPEAQQYLSLMEGATIKLLLEKK